MGNVNGKKSKMIKHFRLLPLFLSLLYVIFFMISVFTPIFVGQNDFEGLRVWLALFSFPMSFLLDCVAYIIAQDLFRNESTELVVFFISGILQYALVGWIIFYLINKRNVAARSELELNEAIRLYKLQNRHEIQKKDAEDKST
jgi:hypothetical protein